MKRTSNIKTKEELKEKLEELIENFVTENGWQQNEDHIQTFYTIKLLECLGWNGRNAKIKKAQDIKNQKFPDITLKNDENFPLLIIESKTAVKTERLDEGYPKLKFSDQLIRYCADAGIYWGVLTNFVEWRVYNSHTHRLYKNKKYAFHKLLWKNSKKENYIDILSDEGLDFLFNMSVKSLCQNQGCWDSDPVYRPLQKDLDEKEQKGKFFISLKSWRNSLVNCIKSLDHKHAVNVDVVAQKILDRLIFIKICRDRGIIGQDILSEVLHATQKYEILKVKFQRMNELFNSELFSKDEIDGLNIKNEIIEPILKGINEIDFSKLNAHIIGEVYENFLGELQKSLELTSGGNKRQLQGIYYTPQYIVKYIVENTIGENLRNVKSEEEIEKLKVIDIACGSGSFLICVFDAFYEAYKRINKGQTLFDFDIKRKILQNNIYGVDLDERAIEITKLNLMIKALEGTKPETLTGQHLLPNLNFNIRRGNSLVSIVSTTILASQQSKLDEILVLKSKFYQNEKNVLEQIFVTENYVYQKLLNDTQITATLKENLFNFEVAFYDVIKDGGFDAVVGNPPYLREKGHKHIFDIVRSGDYHKYLQGKMDYWYFFLHRAIDLAKQNGTIGFITNSYFTKGDGAQKLIQRIREETVMKDVVDFDDIKIFGNVSGKHLIHIYEKAKGNEKSRTKYRLLQENEINGFNVDKKCKQLPYLQIFDDDKISFDIDTIVYKSCKPLDDLYDSSVGIQEGPDKVNSAKAKEFGLDVGAGVFVVTKKELEAIQLTRKEQEFVKRYVDMCDVEKYRNNFNNQYLFYMTKENCPNIAKYPNIQKHLLKFKRIMDERRETRNGLIKWYQTHWPRDPKYYESHKLICKGMFAVPEFTFDDEKYYAGMSFSLIIQKDADYSLKYLLGLLNSSLGAYWFNKHGKRRGIGVDIGVKVFRKFPVFCASHEQQGKIKALVNETINIKKKMTKDLNYMDKGALKIDFSAKEMAINEAIYEIYGLTKEEIEIVEKEVGV
jgi:methylase of polypeptide subunit release factors